MDTGSPIIIIPPNEKIVPNRMQKINNNNNPILKK